MNKQSLLSILDLLGYIFEYSYIVISFISFLYFLSQDNRIVAFISAINLSLIILAITLSLFKSFFQQKNDIEC